VEKGQVSENRGRLERKTKNKSRIRAQLKREKSKEYLSELIVVVSLTMPCLFVAGATNPKGVSAFQFLSAKAGVFPTRNLSCLLFSDFLVILQRQLSTLQDW
jgi:hypothetical protein